MQAAKRTAEIREEVEETLRQMREKLSDVERVVALCADDDDHIVPAAHERTRVGAAGFGGYSPLLLGQERYGIASCPKLARSWRINANSFANLRLGKG